MVQYLLIGFVPISFWDVVGCCLRTVMKLNGPQMNILTAQGTGPNEGIRYTRLSQSALGMPRLRFHPYQAWYSHIPFRAEL